jgi:trimeric autotransporter adhesin
LPLQVSFGNVTVGMSSAAVKVTVENIGHIAAPALSVSIGGADAFEFAQANDCNVPLAAGARCSIVVSFEPGMVGSATGTLFISGDGSVSVLLSGTGTQ